MTEMIEVVVTMPKGLYDILPAWSDDLAKLILKGTVLPKEHGKLKDVNTIQHLWESGNNLIQSIVQAPTIIDDKLN